MAKTEHTPGVAYKIQDHAWVYVTHIGPHRWECPSRWLGGGVGATPAEAASAALGGGIPKWAFSHTRKQCLSAAAGTE